MSATAGPAGMNGHLKTRVISDFGNITVTFPLPEDQEPGMENDKREPNHIEISSDNVLYGSSDKGSQIVLGTEITFGVHPRFLQENVDIYATWLPDVSFASTLYG